MLTATIIFIIIFSIFVIAAFSMKDSDNSALPKLLPKPHTPITKNRFITEHEKTMYGEIRQSVPECCIFVQVSFGALLKTSSWNTRNTFNRKIADFVITDNYFNILAIIELDDKSHDGKEKQDAERDAMLKQAGYKVLRYRYMPDKTKLRSDILN